MADFVATSKFRFPVIAREDAESMKIFEAHFGGGVPSYALFSSDGTLVAKGMQSISKALELAKPEPAASAAAVANKSGS